MTAAAKLRELAAREAQVTRLPVQEWPEFVWRAYHVGRRQAFSEAAEIVAAVENEREEQHEHHHV